jgi:FixJ family two-component response regulator
VRLEVKTYASGAAFLENSIPEARARAGVRPPSTSGLKFQEELARADVQVPQPWRHRHGIAPSAAGE